MVGKTVIYVYPDLDNQATKGKIMDKFRKTDEKGNETDYYLIENLVTHRLEKIECDQVKQIV